MRFLSPRTLSAIGVCNSAIASAFDLPAQAVYVDLLSYSVLGANGSFRESSFDNATFFNPTLTAPPFFQVFHEGFLDILGPSSSIREIASNASFAFAHEAPIYFPETDEMFFASNDGGSLGMSDLYHNNVYGKISLSAAEDALEANPDGGVVNVPVTELALPEEIQMTNGGTGPYKGSLLLITSGRGTRAPSIALVNPREPHNVTVLLDNFFGRQFNSLNDIKVHPSSGKFFFTDVTYGYLFAFRPAPLMPNQVYRFDPDTGNVRVVADGFVRCNGIAFTGDGRTAYVSDTGASGGNLLGVNQTLPTTIYAFNIDENTQAFKNRRVFAYVDAGVPDGIQVDAMGNVYTGCGDGVQVFNEDGIILGKFFLGTTSANMAFAGDGRLLILADTKIILAHIAAKGVSLGGPSQ
ncbi:calcium-dependent phosphotriesterase [Desarmillaria tabescens]|uniref:Calcium-dependent phosphotriesterase n=1 Tax=Armillaria tabescens TaxID=1929756 RepID=A0AA39KCY6_ARMTA|nr:calcium-dependent phosphotriesterase [Desarmillaria tabescens]KAK0458886.1 calcium-dependent phosphotriesterase [Desarmillaria tabescens]